LGAANERAAGAGICCVYGVHGGAEAGWGAAEFEPAAAEFSGDDRARDEWQAAGAGWSVCRVKGTDWRLLPDRCGGSGCGDFLGGAVSGGKPWDGGSAASVVDVAIRDW